MTAKEWMEKTASLRAEQIKLEARNTEISRELGMFRHIAERQPILVVRDGQPCVVMPYDYSVLKEAAAIALRDKLLEWWPLEEKQ